MMSGGAKIPAERRERGACYSCQATPLPRLRKMPSLLLHSCYQADRQCLCYPLMSDGCRPSPFTTAVGFDGLIWSRDSLLICPDNLYFQATALLSSLGAWGDSSSGRGSISGSTVRCDV